MLATTQTEYLLRMELIALDEHLCRALSRSTMLCERAEKYNEMAEVERIREVNRILISTKWALDRLS
jgi:hypothetical protein